MKARWLTNGLTIFSIALTQYMASLLGILCAVDRQLFSCVLRLSNLSGDIEAFDSKEFNIGNQVAKE